MSGSGSPNSLLTFGNELADVFRSPRAIPLKRGPKIGGQRGTKNRGGELGGNPAQKGP